MPWTQIKASKRFLAAQHHDRARLQQRPIGLLLALRQQRPDRQHRRRRAQEVEELLARPRPGAVRRVFAPRQRFAGPQVNYGGFEGFEGSGETLGA